MDITTPSPSHPLLSRTHHLIDSSNPNTANYDTPTTPLTPGSRRKRLSEILPFRRLLQLAGFSKTGPGWLTAIITIFILFIHILAPGLYFIFGEIKSSNQEFWIFTIWRTLFLIFWYRFFRLGYYFELCENTQNAGIDIKRPQLLRPYVIAFIVLFLGFIFLPFYLISPVFTNETTGQLEIIDWLLSWYTANSRNDDQSPGIWMGLLFTSFLFSILFNAFVTSLALIIYPFVHHVLCLSIQSYVSELSSGNIRFDVHAYNYYKFLLEIVEHLNVRTTFYIRLMSSFTAISFIFFIFEEGLYSSKDLVQYLLLLFLFPIIIFYQLIPPSLVNSECEKILVAVNEIRAQGFSNIVLELVDNFIKYVTLRPIRMKLSGLKLSWANVWRSFYGFLVLTMVVLKLKLGQ